jgi:hypothetical protein
LEKQEEKEEVVVDSCSHLLATASFFPCGEKEEEEVD